MCKSFTRLLVLHGMEKSPQPTFPWKALYTVSKTRAMPSQGMLPYMQVYTCFVEWLPLRVAGLSCDHTIQAGLHVLSLAAPSTPPDQTGLPLDPSQSHHASFNFQQDT